MPREPRVVYILQKHKVGTKGWEICWGTWSTASTKEEGENRAKRFTEESVGWKFRVRPYLELTPLKKDSILVQ